MRKGIYEIFTVIFFIFIMLAAVFFWLFISGTTTLIKAEEGSIRLSITLARENFQAIAQCNGGAVFSEERILSCLSVQRDFVKAVMIEQLASDGCASRSWGSEDFALAVQDTSVNTYSYWVPVSDSGSVCFGRLVIAL